MRGTAPNDTCAKPKFHPGLAQSSVSFSRHAITKLEVTMNKLNPKSKSAVATPNVAPTMVPKKSTSAIDTPLEAAKGNDDVMSQPPRKTGKKAS